MLSLLWKDSAQCANFIFTYLLHKEAVYQIYEYQKGMGQAWDYYGDQSFQNSDLYNIQHSLSYTQGQFFIIKRH